MNIKEIEWDKMTYKTLRSLDLYTINVPIYVLINEMIGEMFMLFRIMSCKKNNRNITRGHETDWMNVRRWDKETKKYKF
jgi:hypothetical protein